jgi:glucokinase
MASLAIGIDLGGTNLKGVVMSEDGAQLHTYRVPTEARKGGKQVLQNIANLVGKLIELNGGKDDIRGVGMGTPGFVDNDGLILGGAENIPGWKGNNMFAPVREKYRLPVTAGNDVTVAALAEAKYGAGRGINNMALFALGTGIGGGIVVNGHVYKGTHGMAGELGHIPVEHNGLPCTCGRKGCVEQYASATGIVTNAIALCAHMSDHERTPFVDYVNQHPDAVTSKTVYDFLAKGDPGAKAVHEFVCDHLARAVGVVIDTLAPDRIVLGGGVMQAGQVIVDTVAKYVPLYCWPTICERCDIVQAACGDSAGVVGAAALVFDEMV